MATENGEETLPINESNQLKVGDFCIAKGLGAAISGGVLGSVFGAGVGLFNRQGFKGAIKEGKSSAKTFAIMSAVHSIVMCLLQRVGLKNPAMNAGIAGCATGMALGWGGPPLGILSSCAGFGVFSYVIEYMNPQPALAITNTKDKMRNIPLMHARRARASKLGSIPALNLNQITIY